ncbi:MAG: glycosyltransferase family 4 protein [bacterium]
MKIIYLSSSIVPSQSANSIQVMRMCAALARADNEVTLVARRRRQCGEDVDLFSYYGVDHNFKVKTFLAPNIRYGSSLFALTKLRCLIKAYRSNEVLIYGRDIYGVCLALHNGFRVIYETHAPPGRNVARRVLEGWLLRQRRLVKCVTISKALRAEYCRLHRAVAEKIEVHHDAADCDDQLYEKRSCDGSAASPLQVGYVGKVLFGRGIELIVEMANQLPDVAFHIIGGTKDDVVAYVSSVPDNLHCHGYVAPAEAGRYRAMCDVLLMPYQNKLEVTGRKVDTSRWMSPLKMFEYMASGKAIVASDIPVLREVLDKTNSVLVHPGNVDEWVNAVTLLKDPCVRRRYADAARSEFERKYTWDVRAKNVLRGINVAALS